MRNVSTLAPRDVVVDAIRRNYSDLVSDDLLQKWIASPVSAPGRQVSSPWPDHIDIQSTSAPSDDAAVIDGAVVEMTSAGEARRTPVRLTLHRSGGEWRITDYAEQKESAAEGTPVAVVEEYYRAISAGDFRRAYRSWGDSGPPGQTFDQFVKGFADTASVAVTPGEPSPVEGAAGSRYVQVPVVVSATLRSGEVQRFSGAYTLRRSVVDGASAAERRWHLYRGSLQLARSETRE